MYQRPYNKCGAFSDESHPACLQGSDSNVMTVQVGQGRAVEIDLTSVVQPLERALATALSSISATVQQPSAMPGAAAATASIMLHQIYTFHVSV